MKKLLTWMTSLLLCAALTACAATAEERTGEAEGYGGPLKVTVTLDGDKITAVKVTEHHETEGVGTRAIDALPDAIVRANSAAVDAVTGATKTSNAIMMAVRNAMGQPGPSVSPEMTVVPGELLPDGVRTGVGMTASGRIGPGKDDQEGQVYSFNVVFADGLFDAQGRIVALAVDQLEVATPNYDGASMPHFSGFPGQGGFALWDDAQGKVNGKTEDTDDSFLAEVSTWRSKRARGDDYPLNTGTWASQMDAYERLFTGMTVEEIEGWFEAYCSGETGRPLQEDSDNEADRGKYDALNDDEKAMLADVTSSATMSLSDAHGDILGAIRAAWENAQNE